MKFTIAAVIVFTAWTAGVLDAFRLEQAATSTLGGVYSEAQATRGEALYTKTCAECHGEDLAGDGVAPSLKGPEFMNNWTGATLAELHERIVVSMPPENPDTITAKEKVDIVAYLLKQAGFPAGTTDLSDSADVLKGIKIDANKPGGR